MTVLRTKNSAARSAAGKFGESGGSKTSPKEDVWWQLRMRVPHKDEDEEAQTLRKREDEEI